MFDLDPQKKKKPTLGEPWTPPEGAAGYIDLDPGRLHYFTQLDNKYDPAISCQCTTVFAGCSIVCGDIWKIYQRDKLTQPEDQLRYFCGHDPGVLALFRKSHPGSTIHPSEWADVLVYATNTLFGRKVVYFQDGLSRNVIEDDLRKGLPVAASMRFPERGVAGHYVLVVGMYNDNLVSGPEESEKYDVSLVIAGCNRPETFQTAEQPPRLIPPFIQLFVIFPIDVALAFGK